MHMSMNKFIKPLSFLPAILVLMVIFSFSEQNGEQSGDLSYKVTCELVEKGTKIIHKEPTRNQFEHYVSTLHLPVRKLAHMTEYAVLALCFLFPYRLYGLKRAGLAVSTLFSCILAASLDEFHQGFVAGRGPSVIDVMIDTSGALIGFLAGLLLLHIINSIIKKRMDHC